MATAKVSQFHGMGRRKSATARVFIRPLRSGDDAHFIINGRALKQYFTRADHAHYVQEPLQLVNQAERFYVQVNVRGGGISGQAGAVRLGLARALLQYDESDAAGSKSSLNYRQTLSKAKMLTCDDRQVERKKFGLRKARKRRQYSKR